MNMPRSRFVGLSEVIVGPFTYGDEKLKIAQWGEGKKVIIGKFCSFAGGITMG